ncbi:DUF559 domain-containing protein [Pseudarthrobacter psychrotolerans]|uniref:DUF559 domain-containing protein n=1 Tax=Pseudarthrobacter psychrotolerans TaxID=2697569 RepID=A0A6P1NKG5_9MICC|nr:zinc-ribbon domain-containing protein [Pseudarthrobacter psychrotolerans]QHK18984.1 DUF559 domain-containing protein [Pseudarthrobacter psychrotolerans]
MPSNSHRKRQQPVRDEGALSLAHLRPDIAAQWDPEKNLFPPTHVRPGSNRPIWWICGNGHSWLAAPYTRVKGHGCASCKGMNATPENNLASSRPDLMPTWHHQRNQTELGLAPTMVLPESNKDVWWICPNDPSHEYAASPAARFRGSGCPYCAGKKVDPSNSVAGTRPILAAEWDPATARRPDDVAAGSDYAANWICRKDGAHRWTAAVSSRPSSGAGCPFCDGKRPTDRNRLDLNRPALAVKWHPTENGDLTPADVSVGSSRRVRWICPQDATHVWSAQVRARALDGDGCKWCAPAIRSRIDIALACEFAAVLGQDVDPVRQERLDLGHNRPHTVDVLIRSLKIVIEFDGSYSHKGKAPEERDLLKTKRLRDAGYRVVRIREKPLALLDPQHDVTVEKIRTPDAKSITSKVLQHMTDLGWVGPETTAAYLASPIPWATEWAEQI